jgi:predicted GNAT family acetyltransferase
VHRGAQEIRLMELALLPAWRGHGIGGALVQTLVQEATEASLPVTLHVEPSNPARRLYLRAGFRHAEELGFYERLVWLPPDQASECDEAAEPGQQRHRLCGLGLGFNRVVRPASKRHGVNPPR